MEKERKITAPEGCEISKVELVDGVAVVTFREKKRKLPKSWEEFCEMFPIKKGEAYFSCYGIPTEYNNSFDIRAEEETMTLPDLATAEAVIALCQLIQLRNCYNGDWVPDFTNPTQDKFTIEFCGNKIGCDAVAISNAILYFKSKELRDEFLRYFRPLIEKLRPLYGIKEGGAE
jgi:hypothetical protein